MGASMSAIEEMAVIIVRNTDGIFFVHRRREDNEGFPGLYGLGAYGMVNEGEDAEHAARRILLQQVGHRSEPIFLFSLTYAAPGFPETGFAYDIRVFEAIPERSDLGENLSEWQSVAWMDREEVSELYRAGKLSPDFAKLYELYAKVVWPIQPRLYRYLDREPLTRSVTSAAEARYGSWQLRTQLEHVVGLIEHALWVRGYSTPAGSNFIEIQVGFPAHPDTMATVKKLYEDAGWRVIVQDNPYPEWRLLLSEK